MANRTSVDRSSSEIGGAGVPASGDIDFSRPLPTSTLERYEGSQATHSLEDFPGVINDILQSDNGVNVLLSRLKQSIASARDFAAFLKKRSALEEEHAQGLKKLSRSSNEITRRPDSRQGSYSRNYEEINRIHDRMADNGIQFALSLHQMHEDLQELAADKERGRKQWKQTGLMAEKRVQESENAVEKAKTKYNSLAEDYDRARTGDKHAGRFGLKGPKSAAQVEEDLHRKTQAADTDYASKVQVAQNMRRDLLSTARPQAIQALLSLVRECDSGLTLQMQKFATFNEKLLLSNGLCVSPLKGQAAGSSASSPSLRDVVYQIDNDRDLRDHVMDFVPKVLNKQVEVKYERHHSLLPTQQSSSPITLRPSGFPGSQSTATTPQQTEHQPQIKSDLSLDIPPSSLPQNNLSRLGPFSAGQTSPHPSAGQLASDSYADLSKQPHTLTSTVVSPPQNLSPQLPHLPQSHATVQSTVKQNGHSVADLPPLRPVFGVSLEDLFNRDGSAVPLVVYQCLQAVDLFGLEVEGIYRLSGTSSHIARLRAIFDNDASQVDFRNPENFFHDVNSVAGLLKQFFRDLPDPLLTREHYLSFIEAARIDDDITRRDSLHATINSLPDPNYATLRALTLHLLRVQEHSAVNRMNAGNLAICFGPTLMGSNSGPNIADAGWQVRVIDTILQNTLQIFDDD